MLFDPCQLKDAQVRDAEEGEPEPPKKRTDPQCHRSTPKGSRRWTAAQIKMATVRSLVGTLAPGEVLHMVGANHWNSHDLIDVMQEQIGAPAELWITVYSVSGPSGVRIQQMVDAGRLTSIHALINHHMARSRADVTAHLAQVADTLTIYPVHAKVYVLRTPERGISIYSSANLTACPWLESAVITESADFADWNIAWIQKAMALADPFSGEYMSKSVRAAVEREREALQHD